MALQEPEGTKDLPPEEAKFYNDFINTAYRIFSRYAYKAIELPMFEQTELFVRGIGSATDVVSKELFQLVSGENLKKMLSGEDIKNKSRFSMRPEGTAGAVRYAVQHGLASIADKPLKIMYAGPMFRAERPEKGRQRQFNQIGIECLGASQASIDAEAIAMLMQFYEEIGLDRRNLRLLINSMGCDSCRPKFKEKLADYLEQNIEEMCEDCNRRAKTNSMRTFDCKNETCIEIMKNAPRISDYLCPSCESHHTQVKELLTNIGIDFEESYSLVRGLDYYTKTVFEVQVKRGLGSQNAIGGGGRYDRLAQEIGGEPVCGLGFALGYERCLLALSAGGMKFEQTPDCEVFICNVDSSTITQAFVLLQNLRNADVSAEMDHQGRSLKSQFKIADRSGASYVFVVGQDELAEGKVILRNMASSEEIKLDVNEATQKCSELL